MCFDSRNENFGAHLKSISSFIFNCLNSRTLKFRKSREEGVLPQNFYGEGEEDHETPTPIRVSGALAEI
jgi:hypothetical protein